MLDFARPLPYLAIRSTGGTRSARSSLRRGMENTVEEDTALHSNTQSGAQYDREWAGSIPEFPKRIGSQLSDSYALAEFRRKRLLFAGFQTPGEVHVYSGDCHAGGRLRVQSMIPVLHLSAGVAPAFAVVAQSLPYSADVHKLPLPLPAGYSAVVAQPPAELVAPVEDRLTGAKYYPGPVVDTRTLVSGRCYVIVWSPQNRMGKYALRIGQQWPLSWLYWLRLPVFWWRVRGWYGLSRARAFVAGAGMLAGSAAVTAWLARKRSH